MPKQQANSPMQLSSLLSPRALLVLLIVTLGFIYMGESDGEWMFDDEEQIIYVSSFESAHDSFNVDCFGLFRPTKNLLFYTWTTHWPDNYQLWRQSAVAIFLGLVPVAYLFFGLFFDRKPWLQLLCTALWASAPAVTAVVCWLSATNILVGMYGFFLYFIFYEKAQLRQQAGHIISAYGWLLLAMLMLASSCFSYEAAMTAPILLMLKDSVRNFDRLKDKRTWVFFFLSIFTLSLYFLLRRFHGGVTNFYIVPTIPTDSDLWVSLSSGWIYMIHAIRWIFPFGMQGVLIMFNPENHKVLVFCSIAVVLGLGILLLIMRNRNPTLFLSLGWYSIAFFPMANVVPLRNGPICDYYLLIPGLGLAIFVVWATELAAKTKIQKWAYGITTIWVLLFCVTTLLWVPQWTKRKALAEQTLSWQPDNFVIHGIIAKEAVEAGLEVEAMQFLESGMELAPWYSPLYYSKVMLLMNQEKFGEAEKLLKELVEIQSHQAQPFVFLAFLYDLHLGEWEKAEETLKLALEKPWNNRYSKTAAINLASIYIKTGRAQFASQIYASLLERYPTDAELLDKSNTLKSMLEKVEADQTPSDGL